MKKSAGGKKIVLVGGCFDILHYGHIVFLKKSKQAGDYLVVLLESDKSVMKKKKRKPFHTQVERAEILNLLPFVDRVVKLPWLKKDREYFDIVKNIKPAIIAVTEGDPQYVNKKKQALKVGARIKVVSPLIKKFSTTRVFNYETFFSNRSTK